MKGSATALCAAISIGETGDVAPEWLHLLPAGEARTQDGRGPYHVPDSTKLIAASLAAGSKLVLDENHATDLAAPKGLSAPACGWIVELQARADGIWGKVDWIDQAGATPIWKKYRGVSPVIAHLKDGTVIGILRASLTNTPNIAGLTSLHAQEHDKMDFRTLLIELLGLGSDADDAAITAAIAAKKDDAPAEVVALQSALKGIAVAAGIAESDDPAVVLAGVQALKGGESAAIVGLQSELTALTGKLNTLTEQGARDKATTFVDSAIAEGRVGVKPVRAEYISMHMRDAAGTEKLVKAMPILKPGTSTITDPAPRDEGTADNPALLAQKAGAYVAKMAAAGVTIDFASAVRAVEAGKAA